MCITLHLPLYGLNLNRGGFRGGWSGGRLVTVIKKHKSVLKCTNNTSFSLEIIKKLLGKGHSPLSAPPLQSPDPALHHHLTCCRAQNEFLPLNATLARYTLW